MTEDYYAILEVPRTAGAEVIKKSYKRLALKLHPDQNPAPGATAAFQRLVRAYETLSDESARRAYDIRYPCVNVPLTSTACAGEAAQILALQRAKQERATRWRVSDNAFASSVAEMKREMSKVEQDIQRLESIRAAEAAEEASRHSWSTWLLSPLYKRPEESEETKARKDRARQERRVEQDMKERRLEVKRKALRDVEERRASARSEFLAANLRDDASIFQLQSVVQAREARARQERERAQREQAERDRVKREKEAQARWEEVMKQQREQAERDRVKREKEAQARREELFAQRCEEAVRKEAAETLRRQQPARHRSHHTPTTCTHAGWWPKVHIRTACPSCSEIWTYLLQCPGCAMRACPRCQAAVRPRYQGRSHGGRAQREAPPSPPYAAWDGWD